MEGRHLAGRRRAAWVEVDLGCMRHNVGLIKAKAGGSEVIGVLKADGYGHGAVKTAETLLGEGVGKFGVATLQEAAALREAGVSAPIIVMSLAARGSEGDLLDLGLTAVISSEAGALAFSREAGRRGVQAGVFVALETGMGRVGFMRCAESVRAIKRVCALPHLDIKGFFSHFATSEAEDRSYARAQIVDFEGFTAELAEAGIPVRYRTMANSGALINLPESRYEAVRPGIAIYGRYPDVYKVRPGAALYDKEHGGGAGRGDFLLRPAMSVKANIVLLRRVPPGFSISYGATFTTERESLIGTLPIGYADGLPRALSGKGHVLLRGRHAPIVGRICMDQCMIDVTDVPGAREYDEAVIMGEQGGRSITPEEMADELGTINYETLVRFGQRLPREYTDAAAGRQEACRWERGTGGAGGLGER